MIKNKIYYMLLGIGLGVIITSSMNIVFNKAEKIEYTDEQIKEKAESLGMISIKENIENNAKEKTEKLKQEPNVETKAEVNQTPEPIQQSKEGHGIVIISKKDTASSIISKLKESDVIENEEEFRALVVKHSLQGKFRTGTYEIEKKLSHAEILKKIIDPTELKRAGLL